MLTIFASGIHMLLKAIYGTFHMHGLCKCYAFVIESFIRAISYS